MKPWLIFWMYFVYSAQNERLLIQDRMRHISGSTCLRFVDVRDYPSQEPLKYLQIRQNSSQYCWTTTEQKNGSVVVTIQLGTNCMKERVILHELVHSLGFRHEHQRVDRKCYVKVFWSKGDEQNISQLILSIIDYLNFQMISNKNQIEIIQNIVYKCSLK